MAVLKQRLHRRNAEGSYDVIRLETTADAVIIGRFAGSTALGGISATGSIINLLINFFMGLSVGAAIAISQHLGAGDDDGAGRHAHNAIATSLVCGFAIAIIGNIYCAPILKLMNTWEYI